MDSNEVLAYKLMVLIEVKDRARAEVQAELKIPGSTMQWWLKTRHRTFELCKQRGIKPCEYKVYDELRPLRKMKAKKESEIER